MDSNAAAYVTMAMSLVMVFCFEVFLKSQTRLRTDYFTKEAVQSCAEPLVFDDLTYITLVFTSALFAQHSKSLFLCTCERSHVRIVACLNYSWFAERELHCLKQSTYHCHPIDIPHH